MIKLSSLLAAMVLVTVVAASGATPPDTDPDTFYENIVGALSHSSHSETNYFSQAVACPNASLRCQSNNEIILQALDELSLSKITRARENVVRFVNANRTQFTAIGEKLMLYVIVRQADTRNLSWLAQMPAQILADAHTEAVDPLAVQTLGAYPEYFSSAAWSDVVHFISHQYPTEFSQARSTPRSVSKNVVTDLATIDPEIAKYNQGEFENKPRVYMFCREDRSYPCLMVIKNWQNHFQRDSDGSLWTQPSLGFSHHMKNYNQANGNTPSGIFRIDGAMAETTAPFSFGKFRRLMLNFVAPSPDEIDQVHLLPSSSRNETWWREAVVARDIGRGLFRIHGTGAPSIPGTHFYPFVPTSGCVAKRENRHFGKTYIDQHLFLQELMVASNLTPTPDNELKIKGLLYVINIDDTHAAVQPNDLAAFGIK